MRKIAFLVRSLDSGGAERQLVTLLKALDKKEEYELSVLCFYSGGVLETELANTKIKIICLEKQGRWNVFSFLLRLIYHLKNIKPDVLHGYLSTQNLLTILLKPLFPSIKMVWGVRASNVDFTQYDWLARLLFQCECFLAQFADLIIINSHAGYAYHLEHRFPTKKMVVIPNGIDTEIFKPDLQLRLKLRIEWGISPETILIGLIGRLDPMKDHYTFLNAAALLSKEKNNIHFVCVGSGSDTYTQYLYQLTKQLQLEHKVIWAKSRLDMPAVYNAVDIVISASAYGEGFANVIGEAMSCEVPCVVTDVGDSALIVGDTGKVVPPKNPQALALGLSSLIDLDKSKRAVLGKMARERIMNNFSVNKLVETTIGCLIK